MRRGLLVMIILMVLSPSGFSQILKIEGNPVLKQTDLEAAKNPRKDAKGHPGGLIKVESVIPGLAFKGNVIGPVEYSGAVYKVYVESGTKKLEVSDGRNKISLKLPKVGSKETYMVRIYHEDIMGYLSCESVPSGASVTLISPTETISLGKTPIRNNVKIKCGNYTLKVHKNNFKERSRKIEIKPDKTTSIKLNLGK